MQGWGLAVVLKPLDQQFKNDEYYFPEDNWQASEDNYTASWYLAHLYGSLASVYSLAHLECLFWEGLRSCCGVSGRKILNNIFTSLQKITETWGNVPFSVKNYGLLSLIRWCIFYVLVEKRGSIDTWKLLFKIKQKVLVILFQKEEILSRKNPFVWKCFFKMILKFQNYWMVWDRSLGTPASHCNTRLWSSSLLLPCGEKPVLEFLPFPVSWHFFLVTASGCDRPPCLWDVRITSFHIITWTKCFCRPVTHLITCG